jgi:hypothetical protein
VESLVAQLLEKQRGARDTECSCPDSTCLDTKSCMHQVTQINTIFHTLLEYISDSLDKMPRLLVKVLMFKSLRTILKSLVSITTSLTN